MTDATHAHPEDMGNETKQWEYRPANNVGGRDGSRDNRPNREPGLFEALGVKSDGPVAAAVEAVRDSLDGFDPGLLTTATPGRRISTVPAIRARISAMAMPAAVASAAAPVDVFGGEIANDDESFSLPGLKPRRSSYAMKWALAFAVSIVTGALAGRASRQHPMRATTVHIATAVGPAVATIARTAAPVHMAHAPVINPLAAQLAPVRNALPAVAAAIEVEQPEVVADEAPIERGHHHHHRGTLDRATHDVLAHAAPAPEAAAVIAPAVIAPAAPAPVANAPIAASTRSETANPPASRSTGSGECTARCAGDLSCAADCVVHGARVARAAEITSAPASASEASAETVPEVPRRMLVLQAIRSLDGAMRECAGDGRGTAYLTITFASTGRVTTAVTEAPYSGTPAGSCMARAARGVTVPPFTRATFSVRAPFAMR